MKHYYLPKLLFLLLFLCAGVTSAFAQNGSLSGRILDEKSQGMPGVTVLIEGTSLGNSTNSDGQFSIQNIPAGPRVVVVSFVGFTTTRRNVTIQAGQNTNVDITMIENTTLLNEAVVVGYGTQRRKDVTGAVATVSSENFVKGQVTNPEQLVQGKIPGVQITSNNGQPGAASTIRIRGGSSLNASNDPLVVIDNVPVDNFGVRGAASILATINPNDIENVTVLKDASATAIYGARASGGVILITTKKGMVGEKVHVNFSTQFSRSKITDKVDVLNGPELRALVLAKGSAKQKSLVGLSNTDWQDEIYRSANTWDNNLSVSGAAGKIPYRASVGYLNQQGLVKTNELKRNTGALAITPMFLNNHLKVDLNIKGSWIDNNFADGGVVGGAVTFDPTQPIKSGNNDFGGYFEWLDKSQIPFKLDNLAGRNPVGLLNQRRDRSTIKRAIGNAQFDYKFHMLPDLRANLNIGFDKSRSNGSVYVPATAAANYFVGGQNNFYAQESDMKLLDFYLLYSKQFGSSKFDLQGGYSYQDFLRFQPAQATYRADGSVRVEPNLPFKTQNTIIGLFGRLNYSLKDRYLLTATFRRDGSSHFENKWGNFPSLALGWRVKDEDFLKNTDFISEFKLRAGYGQTGQQELPYTPDNPGSAVGVDYNYLGIYETGESTAQYQLGDKFYTTLRAGGYDAGFKWETTTAYNAGVDYGFFGGRVYGSLDFFKKKTTDLINKTFVPAGSNLRNIILTNVGDMEIKGSELDMNIQALKSDKLNWTVNFNGTLLKREITKLTSVDNPDFQGDKVGGIAGGVGNTIQINSVGYEPNSFYVYKQVYDASGKPLEGVYVDQNGDGQINDSDLYRYKSPTPRAILGFSSNLTYGNLGLAFTLRSNLDNYVYNNVRSDQGIFVPGSNNFVNNVSRDALVTGFNQAQYYSDYYMENASFLRMQNITLSYNAGNMFGEKTNLGLSLAVQNAFVITKYSGLDPEINSGIDNNFYPRPRTVTVGLNLGF